MENPQFSIGNLIIYKRAMFHSYVSFLEGIMVIFFGTHHQQDWTWEIGRNGIWLSRWVVLGIQSNIYYNHGNSWNYEI
jgi:hypothetical protein